ncbi:6810_t:CDS:2 [Funneliformis geosporum]|uniref:6810_t:CDS:1 n=1 Tax=Funneliformis geosporum TaxID=1117311 RepID=A0A9W4SBL5_9GLOM|nr:6810_t:CDS:2 [Funneliformis geosporum]
MAENKTLLKDALETHLNQASYFTREFFSRDSLQEFDERKKSLNHELETTMAESRKKQIASELTNLEKLNCSQSYFKDQKYLNQKIVEQYGKVVVYKPFVAPWQEAYSSKYSHNYNAPEVPETTPPPISCYEEYQFCLGQILKSLGVNISSPSISLEDIEFAIQEFKKRYSTENHIFYEEID